MAPMPQALRVIRQGGVLAYADLKVVHTWKSWLGGWLVRLMCQVAFYGLIGVAAADSDYRVFIALGAAMMVCITEVMATVASTTWDRGAGTTELLIASPVSAGFFFFGRSLQWPVSGSVTTSVAVFTVAPAFGVTWSAAQVPMVLLLVVLTTFANYCMALLLGSFALRASGARNIISNAAIMTMTAFCGAVVPVDFWAEPVRWLARGIPLTHGLEAVRLLEHGAALGAVLVSAGLTLLTGLVWAVLAFAGFQSVFRHARRAGSR